MTLTITPMQRLNLRALINVQQPGTLEGLFTLKEILDKLDFTKAETESFCPEDTVDFAKLALLDNKEVVLDRAQAKLLRSILNPSDRFKPTIADLGWLEPLTKALDI